MMFIPLNQCYVITIAFLECFIDQNSFLGSNVANGSLVFLLINIMV